LISEVIKEADKVQWMSANKNHKVKAKIQMHSPIKKILPLISYSQHCRPKDLKMQKGKSSISSRKPIRKNL